MNARDMILETVRAQLGRESVSAPPPPPSVPILGRVDLTIAERVELFARRLEAVGGVCHCGDPSDLVSSMLARHRSDTIATSDADAALRLRDDPALAGFRWLPLDCTQDELFAAGVGITAAQWAIADTGTIVLESACERSRLASLVPPVHIALVPASRILCDLGEALKTLGRPLSPAVTLITGPSRTADIELQLVLGVHGPRELHVVLV